MLDEAKSGEVGIRIKRDSDIYRVLQEATREVAKWPKWKRELRVTKYSKGV